MKALFYTLVMAAFIFGCKQQTDAQANENAVSDDYESFGMLITDEAAKPMADLAESYMVMTAGDTLQDFKAYGTILEVCPEKGCWMKLDTGNDETVMVRFKDYGFFMPLDASGEVVIHGKAYVSETSVKDLKHYAKDAGKSQEEIDQITAPEMTWSFEADGVLLKRN